MKKVASVFCQLQSSCNIWLLINLSQLNSLEEPFNMFQTEDWSAIQMINFLSDIGEIFTNSTLSHPNVQNLLKHENNFDAVVVEVFWAEALYGKIENINYKSDINIELNYYSGFGAHFNCPVIALSTFSTSKWTNDLTKAPMEHSYVAHNFIKLSENMNFYERTLNTLTGLYENIFMEMVHYERQVRLQLIFIAFLHCSMFLEENF